MRRIRKPLATTDRIPAYGGFRLSLQELETMLEELKTGAVETRLSHDSRRPLDVENVEAGIEQRPDGEYVLWVQFDADEDQWAEYEAERDAQGGPGGLSFTLTGTFENLPSRSGPTSVSVLVGGDAAHFSDEEIRAAAEALADVGPVKASRLYQFAVTPNDLVLVQFFLQQGAQVPAGVFSAWLYDALRRLRPRGGTPAVDLELIEDGTGRRVTGRIQAQADPEVAKQAIEAWESVSNQAGVYEWMPDGSWRIIRGSQGE
jgi:hypothetical protein